MAESVRIIAPSRLHFGLLSIDQRDERRFGGVGVMLEQPNIELRVRRTKELSVSGSRVSGALKERTKRFVELWQQHTGNFQPVSCEILMAPPEHVGLGLGTQLGLSVAWALDSLFGRDHIGLEDRALSVERGRRSAVGTHGFALGGLIAEDGKSKGDAIGRLRERIQLPEDWCVMLLRPAGMAGLAGDAEVTAFGALPPADETLKATLRRELYDRLLPAAKRGDFLTFAESVYEYGYAAGEAFAAEQGGPFLSSEVADLVEYLRESGVPGVGQSSWGPTVFCWFATRANAEHFLSEVVQNNPNLPDNVLVSPVARVGAQRFIDESV